MPMPARTQSEKDAFWKQIESEMPAFIYHVLNEHKVSDEFADSEEERMGVRGYHHPKALNYVETYSSDGSRLLGIIEVLRSDPENSLYWEGSAGDLVQFLRKKDYDNRSTPTSMGRFLNQRIACGTRLVKENGHRKYWIDTKPREEDDEPSPKKEFEESPTKVEKKPKEDLLEDEDNYYGYA